ncbi:hypothetical protein A8W25_30695 [Streptomyces sp. ERV7]|nr:hypothetical protein A8W25_30695 [Streptomyces sp. ERV7]
MTQQRLPVFGVHLQQFPQRRYGQPVTPGRKEIFPGTPYPLRADREHLGVGLLPGLCATRELRPLPLLCLAEQTEERSPGLQFHRGGHQWRRLSGRAISFKRSGGAGGDAFMALRYGRAGTGRHESRFVCDSGGLLRSGQPTRPGVTHGAVVRRRR